MSKRSKADSGNQPQMSSFFALRNPNSTNPAFGNKMEVEEETRKRKAETLDLSDTFADDLEPLLSHFTQEEQNNLIGAMKEHPEAIETYKSILKVFNAKLDRVHTNGTKRKESPNKSIPKEQPLSSTLIQDTTSNNIDSICSIAALSFVHPRSKFDFHICGDSIQLVNSTSSKMVKQIPISSITRAVCVETAESRQKNQWTFILFIKDDAIVFNLNGEQPPKITWKDNTSSLAKQTAALSPLHAVTNLVTTLLKVAVHTTEEAGFQSSKKNSYVTCHLKAKEGFLYFLPQGLLLGMKKPLLWIPVDKITATEFLNVTSKFFDLVIETGQKSQVEFSCIDIHEYDCISAYLHKCNQLRNKLKPTRDSNTQQTEPQPNSSDESSEDEDFAPKDGDFNDVPEEYDETYGQEEADIIPDEEDEEGEDDEEGGEQDNPINLD